MIARIRISAALSLAAALFSSFVLLAGCGGKSKTPGPAANSEFLFIADLDSSKIDAFTLVPTSGALTAVTNTPFASDYRPISIVVHPTADTFYVANNGNSSTCSANLTAPGSLTAYTYDKTGTPAKVAEHCLPDAPTQLLISSDGSTVFALMPNTGQITALSTSGASHDAAVVNTITVAGGAHPMHMALSSDGKTLYAADPAGLLTVFAVNGSTLTEAAGSPLPLPDKLDDLTCCNGSSLYIVDSNARNLVQYTIASANGTVSATRGGAIATDQFPNHLILANKNANLLVTNLTVGQLSLFGVDANSGAPTAQITQSATGIYPTCIFVDPSNTYFYVTNYHANTVSGFQLSSGLLSTTGSGTTGASPICGAAAHPA
ncbi:MAG: beta-propeller fold lactonase family protein [Acidobacteriaceae bacterium]